MSATLSKLPAVHRVLAAAELAPAIEKYGRATVRAAIRAELDEIRAGRAPATDAAGLAGRAIGRLEREAEAYPPVLNATGVLIHTNLGRAPRLAPALPAYLALEYDLAEGERGERLAPVVDRVLRYFGAEAATVVNNNAAALLLLIAAHAAGREVVVSRGELVEIGGSFRLPDVMAASGATLVEVGCTNRTHLADYERALSERTAAILVVHRSNFHMSGFVSSPALEDLVALGHAAGVPVWVDQGSGCHIDLTRYGLHREPTVRELLATGADAVLFSGDKLLAGPQAGIVAGRETAVAPLRRHPLRRALRPDKGALVGLAATLDVYLSGRPEQVPLYRLLAEPEEALRRRAARLARGLRRGGMEARARATRAVVGGGTTPDQTLASWAVALPGGGALAARLRGGRPAIVGRVESDEVLIDLRAILPEQDRVLQVALLAR